MLVNNIFTYILHRYQQICAQHCTAQGQTLSKTSQGQWSVALMLLMVVFILARSLRPLGYLWFLPQSIFYGMYTYAYCVCVVRIEWLSTLICTERLDIINGQTYKWEYIMLNHTDIGNLMVAAFLSQRMAKVQVFLEGHTNLELSLPYI